MAKQKTKSTHQIYERPSSKLGGSSSWQVKLRENGVNLSKTLKTESEARDWLILKRAKIITGESLAGEKHSDTLLPNIFEDYILNGGVDAKKAAILRMARKRLEPLSHRLPPHLRDKGGFRRLLIG